MTMHSIEPVVLADGRDVHVCVAEPEPTASGRRLRVDVVDHCGCILATATADVRDGTTVGDVELVLLHHKSQFAAGVVALTTLAGVAAAEGLTRLEAFHESDSADLLHILHDVDPEFADRPTGRGSTATLELTAHGGA